MPIAPVILQAIALAGVAPPASATIDFDRDIRPILAEHCLACHGPDARAREAELRLDTADGIAGVTIAGDAAGSLLIERLRTADPDERMPPPGPHDGPTAAEIEAIARWIDAGARWRDHWAFESPAPDTLDRAPADLIDDLVRMRLAEAGFDPAPRQSRDRLYRRLCLDLTGLPPTPEALDAFLVATARDPRDAWSDAIDALLASPAYGERMAWDWLDIARYADTNGFQQDATRTQWPWRDWVVRAFNENLGFDDFTRWQIAGDLVEEPEAGPTPVLASGFLRNHMINGEGGRIAAENVVEYAFDMTETVGTAWLGLTLNCARCHDHKFDPITQREYFSLLDFFHQTPGDGSGGDPHTAPTIEVTPPGHESPVRVMVMGTRPQRRETRVLSRGDYRSPGEIVTAGVPRSLPPLSSRHSDRPADRLDLADWLLDADQPLTARVVVNREWRRFFGRGLVETVEDFGTRGDRPTHPALLDALAATFVADGWDLKRLHRRIVSSDTYAQSSDERPALAAIDPENTLLGRGPRGRMPAWMIRDHALACSGLLVDTMGGPPVKPYQPQGLWSDTTFGTIVYEQDHGDALHRRSLYTFWRRIVGPPIFFDNADRRSCTVRTPITNTPTHALATLNDPTFVEAARAMAQRVLLAEPTDDARLDLAYLLAVSRRPDADERSVLLDRVRELASHYSDDTAAAEALLSVGESPRDPSIDPASHAAWTGICTLILNLDESLTR